MAPPEGPVAEIESLDNSGFEIVERKNKDKLAKPVNVFKILDLKDTPKINNFNHVAPFGPFAHPKATPEFIKWIQNNKRKVIATIIGAHKNINASYAYDKTTRLIQQAAAFISKGKTEIQSMSGRDWIILETKNETAAQALIKARLVHNSELNVVVLFREIHLKYFNIRSITISFLTSKDIYNAFEKALEETLQIKVKQQQN